MPSPRLPVWMMAGVVALVATLGACASDDPSTEDAEAADAAPVDPRPATGLDGPVMRHLEPSAAGGEDAEIRGVIEIEGDCLYVALDEVGERYPIVWPAATSWDHDAVRVLLPTGDSAGHGESVYGGGGYRHVGEIGALAGEAAAALARRCVDNRYGEVAVVNNQAEGIGVGDGFVDHDDPNHDLVEGPEPDGDWSVAQLTVDGARVELDASRPITVTVDGDVISGTAACNQYTGEIDWTADAGFGRFVVSKLSWTKMACEDHVMMVEKSFLDALGAVDSYEAADGLYVGQAGGATNFHLVRPDPGG